MKNCRRFLPHKVKGEGHFAALFRKADGVESVDKQCIKEDDISKSVHKETKDKEKMCKDGKTQNTSKVKNVRIPEAMDEFMREIPEWEQWKNRIIFIKDGQLIAHKTIDELHQKHILCIKTSDNQYAQKILKNYIVTNDNEYIRLECGSDNDFSNVINLLVKNNISIYSIEDKGEGLEKYYQNLYQG